LVVKPVGFCLKREMQSGACSARSRLPSRAVRRDELWLLSVFGRLLYPINDEEVTGVLVDSSFNPSCCLLRVQFNSVQDVIEMLPTQGMLHRREALLQPGAHQKPRANVSGSSRATGVKSASNREP
jgi:hypothetical protein